MQADLKLGDYGPRGEKVSMQEFPDSMKECHIEGGSLVTSGV
jgi:hypothetical protein